MILTKKSRQIREKIVTSPLNFSVFRSGGVFSPENGGNVHNFVLSYSVKSDWEVYKCSRSDVK